MKINLIHELHDPDELMDALPGEPESAPKSIETVWGLFDVLLKAPDRLNPFVRSPSLQAKLSFGFSAIVLIGMGLYVLGIFIGLRFAPRSALPVVLARGWDGGLAGLAGLFAAYPVGILLSSLLTLPSYWFFTLLAGVKMPLLEVLTHSLKGKAASTVLIVGLLPVWGVLMACVILSGAPDVVASPLLWLGLLMPFLAGLRGAGAIQSGFRTVVAGATSMNRSRRASLPDWLTLSWVFLFSVSTPVLMFKAYEMTTTLIGTM